MKTLCVQYTPGIIFISIAFNQTIIHTKSFSSKELKTFIFHLQSLLESSDLKLEEIDTICVNTGPSPAFTQRSLFALINGIAFSLRLQGKKLSLCAIDDFALLCELYQQKQPNSLIVALSNAYANDLFFLYYEKNEQKTGITSLEECFINIKQLNMARAIHIVGSITEGQEQFFSSQGILVTNNVFVSHVDYYVAALLPEAQQRTSVEYLLPQYVKRHQVELKMEKEDNFSCVKSPV